VIGPPRLNRRNAQVIRSQFALELVLSAVALAGAFVVLRLVFKVLSVSERVWTGGLVYTVSDRLVWPLTLLPGSRRAVWGEATLAELTAVAIAVMLPLLFAIRGWARPD
jgi:hypothetical protein